MSRVEQVLAFLFILKDEICSTPAEQQDLFSRMFHLTADETAKAFEEAARKDWITSAEHEAV